MLGRNSRLGAAALGRVLLVSLLLPMTTSAQDATDNTPLVGTWVWTRAENRCTEVYDFRRDGVAYVVSGEERTENTFSLSAKPGPVGRRRLVITTTKYYGGNDCADQTEDTTGKPSTSYVLFYPGGGQMILCADESSDNCVGPLIRLNP